MSPVSRTQKTPSSLAGTKNARGLSPSSSPAIGASSISTSAASREVQPKLSVTEYHAAHCLRQGRTPTT
ncbi:hypothetical protein Plhal710r2_c011g0050431 [Plasmopara halstedii]